LSRAEVGTESDMNKLHVIIASTRPGRVGLPIGRWFFETAGRHGKWEVRLVDLAEVNLPLLDEPQHPRFGKYEHAHTKAWSATVAEADAYVLVTPEYNFSPPASLMNALDFVFNEWLYKPVGFVSYGGPAGGTRAVQMLKLKVTALKMMPMYEAVMIPLVTQFIADGAFKPTEAHEAAAHKMLDELGRWADALKVLRRPA
jgi:NAD(P)H-dependent FMN reductase